MSTRNGVAFSRLPGTPTVTPADRLDALHALAQTVRNYVSTDGDPERESPWRELCAALHHLDAVERRLGVPTKGAIQ